MPTFLGPFSLEDFPEVEFLKKVNLVSAEFSYLQQPGTLNLGDIVLTGTQVIQVLIKVKTPFTGNPSLTIGTNSNPQRFADSSQMDLSEPGVYLAMVLDTLEMASQIRAFWNPNGANQGEIAVFALITDP
jgi:hypothetical protein